jgi:hypothetical protein
MRKILLQFLSLILPISVFCSNYHFYDKNGNYQGSANESDITIIPQVPNTPSASEKLGEGFGDGIGLGMIMAIKKAKQRNEQISKIKMILNRLSYGYSRENHDDYIKTLYASELPYSMKIGLVKLYNFYRKERDVLDFNQNNKFRILASKIIEGNSRISKPELIELTMLMDPTINQNSLRKAINSLNITDKDKKEIHDFVSQYYKIRTSLYEKVEKDEKNLINE